MSLIPSQEIEVRVALDDYSQMAIDDRGATVSVVDRALKVFLPASEYPREPKSRLTFLRDLRSFQPFTVRVQEYDDAKEMWVVSRQAVLLGNPWRDEVRTWIPGVTLQRMRVTNVHADQVYGEIIPGVTGKTSLRDVRAYLGKQDETMTTALVGDYLIGYVGPQDFDNQIVPLDVVAYLQSLDKQSIPSETSRLSGHPGSEYNNNHSVPLVPALHTVLVVDDEEKYLHAMERRLRADGLDVLLANSAQKALSIALPSKYDDFDSDEASELPDIDVAIIDVNLNPTGDRIAGLYLAHKLRKHRQEIKILLTSGDTSTRTQLAKGDALGLEVHGFIAKPFGPTKLREELARVMQGALARPTAFLPIEGGGIDVTPRRPESVQAHLVERHIRAFGEHIGAETVTLFALHRISLVTDVIAGDRPLYQWNNRGWDFWRHKLRQSPVRDVAIDGTPRLEHDATDKTNLPRNRWLQRAYRYRSCIGVPVRVIGQDAYCLFAFHSSSERFTREHLEKAKTHATELATVIEKERLLRVLAAETRYVTSGITLNVLGHELNTTLVTAELNAGFVYDLTQRPDVDATELHALVQELREDITRAGEICAVFQDLARKDRISSVPVRACIERAGRFAKRRVEELGASLVADDLPKDLYVRVERVAFEQTLFNLFVNAAEQCQRFGKRQGHIRITARRAEESSQQVQILVTDNGPGIYYCWWKEVFEPGFTTKDDGSGLGLHICRQTTQRLQGTVRVRESDLWGGTTFEVMVPVATPDQEGA